MIGCVQLPAGLDTTRLLPILAEFTPAVEPAEPYIFLDLGQLANQRPADLLDQLYLAVTEAVAQPPGLGLASGKFPAQIAAASLGPGRGLVIAPGCEAGFLQPLPIALLPLDDELARQFRLLGLRTLGQLADLPAKAVANRFGRSGRWLQRLAQGQDDRPVRPWQTPPVESLTYTLDPPLTNRLALERLIEEMLGLLVVRLRAAHRLCHLVQLTLNLTGDVIWQETIRLRRPAQAVSSLLLAIQGRLARLDFQAGITELTLILADLVPASGRQPALFNLEPGQPLGPHLPALLARFGPARFYTVELIAPEAHLPEQRFRLRPLETK